MTRLIVLLGVLLSWQARAELTIEITQGVDNPTRIAVVPFGWQGEGVPSEDLAQIVASDLHRSGQFSPLDRGDMLSFPTQASEVFFRDWRALASEYVLIGRATRHPALGKVEVSYQLFDVVREGRVVERSVSLPDTQWRDLAHTISDDIFEVLTGIPGAFRTKVLYVSTETLAPGNFIYRLLESDIDGARERLILESREPILTPVWAPDGETVAYVSFETTRPAVWKHNLRTGAREQLTDFRGLNGAPAWSPDGRQLALTLSNEENADIYVLDLESRALTRVTRHFAIDTEPAWMPDGKRLVFTSDRGGQPQIYQVTLASGYIERLTFDGDYNARARVLPDGNGLVLVHRSENQTFHIGLLDLRRGVVEVLTETELDESPTISPNGVMLMYATKYQGRGILAAVSVDGGVRYRIPSRFGDVREPAWSPLLHR